MAVFLIESEEKYRRMLHRHYIRDYANPFELPENEFYRNYRMNKDMAIYLCNELSEELRMIRSIGIPIHIRVLLCINYLATGAYQRKIGNDQNLSVAQTTISKYIDEVVKAINRRLKPRWILFPGNEEARRREANKWQEKFGLPDILGAIDCTHVTIFPPPRPEGLQYINRKGEHSINVQLIADADCKVLNVNAQFPGRVHDQFLFNNSIIKTELQRLYRYRIGEYYLLGDSGYALEPWLITPILHAQPGSPEDSFTNWHTKARNVIERTNGYLKGTMRCLGIDQNLHYAPQKACRIIYAACTIYNIMKHFRVPLNLDDSQNHNDGGMEAEGPLDQQSGGIEKRNRIVRTYFN